MPDSPIQQIVCCMGQPVAGNPTQFMMERAFAAANLDWRYLTLEVGPEDLADAVRGLRAMGFQGGNLAAPHKQAVVSLLDALSDTAELIEQVNCILRREDALVGENTEGKGFLEALRPLCDPGGKNVVLLGAGGVARAIAVEMAQAGAARLTIVNRTAERGRALVDRLHQRGHIAAEFVHLSGSFAVDEGTHIVINATSIGSDDEETLVPLDMDSLRPEMLVADVTWNPPRTRLISDAAAKGCTTLDGLGMFVCQGIIAFKLWTGVDPDPAVMREALEEYLEI